MFVRTIFRDFFNIILSNRRKIVHFKYYFDVYYLTRKLGMLPFHKMWNGAKVLRSALDYHAMAFYA